MAGHRHSNLSGRSFEYLSLASFGGGQYAGFRGWYSGGNGGDSDNALQKVADLDRETTFAEDLELVKNVQRGLRSKGYQPGPLIVASDGGIENEWSIAMLHRWF